MVVAFTTDRGPVRVRFAAEITATQPVVVASRPIEAGQVSPRPTSLSSR